MIKIIYENENEFREHLYKYEFPKDYLSHYGIPYHEKNDIYKYFLEMSEKHKLSNVLCENIRHEYCGINYFAGMQSYNLRFCLDCGYLNIDNVEFYKNSEVLRIICSYEILNKSIDDFIGKVELYKLQSITDDIFESKEDYKLYVMDKIYHVAIKSAIE